MARTKFSVKDGISVSTDSVPAGFELIPPGIMMAYAGSSAPDGWLLCDGTAYSRTTYANLFAAISTTFGSGDGSTTFNLPNTKGRTLVGAGTGDGGGSSASSGVISGGSALTARPLGSWYGRESVTLIANNLPAHTHGLNSHTHGASHDHTGSSGGPSGGSDTASAGIGSPSPSGTQSTSINHNHSVDLYHYAAGNHEHRLYYVTDGQSGTNKARVSASGTTLSNSGITTFEASHTHTFTNGTSGDSNPYHNHDMYDHRHSSDHYHGLGAHTHTVTVNSKALTTDGPSTSNTTDGGYSASSAVENMQPMLAVNYIIKY
jgi:microcystin-dependent protein